MTMTAAPLQVTYHAVTGATADSDSLWIEQNGDYRYLSASMTYASGTAAVALGLTQSAGAYLSTPGQAVTSPSAWMNNIVQNQNSQWSSFQTDYPTASDTINALAAWSAASGGQFQYLENYTNTTTPIVPSSSAAEIVDPAGTYSGPGASAPTPAAAGTYIPGTGATSSAAEKVDPAGTSSAAGASAPTTDPAGTYSAAGASAPTTDPAGTYSAAGASAPTTDPAGTYSAAGASAPTTDPAGTYSAARASTPTTDPAGTYSAAGASAPTPAAAGTYIAGAGATSAAAEMTDRAGTYSAAGASAPTTDPAGTYSAAGASAATTDPAGTSSAAGASAPTTDPAGTYSTAGASAPTTDPAGTYSTAGASAPTTDPAGTSSAAGASTPTTDPAGTYSAAGASAPTIDPAGTSSAAGASAPTTDPAGTYSAAGASAPTTDPAGMYSAAGASAPTTDPAGTSSAVGASAPTTDPAGTSSAAGASTPTTDPAGTYSAAGASAPTIDPAGTSSAAGASAPTTDPAGTYSAAGASAPTTDPAGTSSAAGASAPTTDPAGTYSAAGASAPTTDPAGTYSPAGASASTTDPAGTYSAASASAATTDPAGTYSAAGASAPTTDPAGTYSAAGASALTTDPAGTYSAAGASAPTTDLAGSYSLAGASASTLAQVGYYVPTAGASSETPDDPGYYTPYAGATAEILALPPVISGTSAGQSVDSGQSDTPFTSVTIADPNIESSDSLSIQLTGAGGTLADGAGFTGLMTSTPGVYTLSGSAAAVTSELEALVFTPGAGSGTTTFTLTDDTSVGTSASDATTALTVLFTGTDVVSVATFLTDQPNLDQTQGGFDIADTAADITANLDQLNDPNIDAIIVSDNGQVGASVQQLTSDAAAIGKLSNQNGSPGQLAISDTAADITARLNGLDGSNIGSITISDNNAVGVSVVQLTSDAAAISKLANQNGRPYQLAVTDTAADITAALDSLDGSNIASITISDNNAVGASVAQLTSDATAISKLANQSGAPYQLAVTDTAAHITAALNSLDRSNIGSITISDNNAVGASVAELTSDATAIGKLSNQNGTPGQLAISDTAADITAGLNGLNGSNIVSITISDDNAVGVSVVQLTSDAAAISKLANQNGNPYQLAVNDTTADITAALDSLDGSNIASITISDNNAVGASVAQLTSDATAISKLANQSGAPYQLAVTDTAAHITAALNSLDSLEHRLDHHLG